MAALEFILSQARRHCSTKSSSYLRLRHYSKPRTTSPPPRPPLPFLEFNRSLCSESAPAAEAEKEEAPRPNEPTRRPPKPTSSAPIQSVSYPVKPKSEQDLTSQPPRRERDYSDKPIINAEEVRGAAWTREDIRYVKNIPKLSPVSYPSRLVAPLPEDRLAEDAPAPSDEGQVKEERNKDAQLDRETVRIQADNRRFRWALRGVEEERLPFPTLIKQQQQNKDKVIFDLQEAIRLVKVNAKANFNETVEVHVNLAAELRRTDLKLDGIATLPHGTGKAAKIAVFADGSAADEARAAGANVVGGVELVEEIKNGNVKAHFDICITTHQFVPRLQKLGNILKSRMPSTKAGTVTDDVAKAVREAKRLVKFNKKDKAAVVHVGIGKVSYSEEALRENIGAFVNALLAAKPAGLKKSSKYAGYVNSVHICSTMGPGFSVSIQSLSIAADHYNRLQLN
ncbi:uncharacterized protein LOC114293002 isoform X1 [Camellia sinensis]|uniref:uncharacterized protein LOC114293002 isoform X1 n=2 Tax=Camellia sinensis TaxID=4442 RepID=UPI001035BEE2|nr:uncharacterized protein LOC114293002 isoform X1 [Camellia sinensis]XP_028092809.1 uncharacterized protein LOC114293002 isoform X1 [Camellia sinensis]